MTNERCNCASGTAHNDGDAILAAVRNQQRHELHEPYERKVRIETYNDAFGRARHRESYK